MIFALEKKPRRRAAFSRAMLQCICMADILKRYTGKLPKNSFTHLKRHWLSVAFLLGFVLDNLTLNSVEQLFDNLVLLFYVVVSMSSILILYAAAAGKFPETWTPFLRAYAPLVVQFSFGGLLSGMLIFYGRSGTWAESWPFLIIIVGVILGNEFIKNRSSRFLFNIAILFVGLFSYVVLIIPVLSGYMGPWIFIGSGLIALFIIYGFVRALALIIPNFLAIQMRSLVFMIGSIFAVFNFLYFANIIPPIPLSLKDVGIYHSVVRFESGEYQVKYEEGTWWQFYKDSDIVFHPDGGSAFCYASVFAPTRLATDIYHSWDYYDEETGDWIEHARLSYSIEGGRDSGYRGYTLINNFRDGTWRCSVETERGQVLGRETFTIDSTEPPRELITRTE